MSVQELGVPLVNNLSPDVMDFGIQHPAVGTRSISQGSRNATFTETENPAAGNRVAVAELV
jgi:hypothetical protein